MAPPPFADGPAGFGPPAPVRLGAPVPAGDVAARLARLRDRLRSLDPLVVAFSGGADSTLLAVVAHQALGERAVAVTAVSPSLPASERAAAAGLAVSLGFAWREVHTDELDRDGYVANGPDRCAHCKDALLDAVAAGFPDHAVALGVVLDDLGDHRPGQAAAAARGAVFPLAETGFTKADVRAASRLLGLPTASKPAAACLASRLPYGTAVTAEALAQVEAAEAALARLGFDACRVRHHGDVARVEIPEAQLERALDRREAIVAGVRAAGFAFVALDLEGLRSGSLNRVLGGG